MARTLFRWQPPKPGQQWGRGWAGGSSQEQPAPSYLLQMPPEVSVDGVSIGIGVEVGLQESSRRDGRAGSGPACRTPTEHPWGALPQATPPTLGLSALAGPHLQPLLEHVLSEEVGEHSQHRRSLRRWQVRGAPHSPPPVLGPQPGPCAPAAHTPTLL